MEQGFLGLWDNGPDTEAIKSVGSGLSFRTGLPAKVKGKGMFSTHKAMEIINGEEKDKCSVCHLCSTSKLVCSTRTGAEFAF